MPFAVIDARPVCENLFMNSPRALAGRALRRAGLRTDPWDAPLVRLPPESEAYRRLTPSALAFDNVVIDSSRPAISLVIPSVVPGRLSAGPMTALRLACSLAAKMNMPVRIITTDHWRGGPTGPGAEANFGRLFPGIEVSFAHIGRGQLAHVSESDLWIATSWTTALLLKVASQANRLQPSQVLYLVQDYEPAFNSWSADFSLAQSTYHAGFTHIVNSRPLADFLLRCEGVQVDRRLVLGPDLSLDRLAEVAAQRKAACARNVFVYGRPSVARNMFPLALAAIEHARRTCDVPFSVIVAGENVSMPKHVSGAVQVVGLLDTDGYYNLMSRTGIALSLMLSPHPSHPPLDWAVSGGVSITNRFEDLRDELHPRVISAEPDPEHLGYALAEQLRSFEVGQFAPLPDPLGRSLDEVAAFIAGSR